MEWVLLALLIFSNYLWFVAFYYYRKEIKRQLRKAGYEKYVNLYMARLVARLDEVQRVGHLKTDKNTASIYHYNDDGSTVILLEDREDELKRLIDKGPAGMELDHVQPISKTVNFTNGDIKK